MPETEAAIRTSLSWAAKAEAAREMKDAHAALWQEKRSFEKVTYPPCSRLAFISNKCLNSNRSFETICRLGDRQWG
jgi:hypothetical protein